LKVRFAPAFLTWLPFVWADYWVLALDPAYRHAAVGTPDRDYLWILSRTPQMDPDDYEAVLGRVAAMGFDVARLERTRQAREQGTGGP
jgi:apolipoprotein D and lipocalin family protein